MKNIKRNLLICLLVVFCSVALAGCNNKVKDELAAANDKIAELEKQLEEANANKDSIAKQLADAQTALKAAEDNEAAAKNELDALKDKYMDTLEKVCKKELVFTNLDELFGEADATGVYTAETGTTYNLNVALVYTYTPEGADEPTFTSEEFELNKDDVVLDYIWEDTFDYNSGLTINGNSVRPTLKGLYAVSAVFAEDVTDEDGNVDGSYSAAAVAQGQLYGILFEIDVVEGVNVGVGDDFNSIVELETTATAQLKVSDGFTATAYASSDDSVATVSATGLITAVAKGTATITVTVKANDSDDTRTKLVSVTVLEHRDSSTLAGGEEGATYNFKYAPLETQTKILAYMERALINAGASIPIFNNSGLVIYTERVNFIADEYVPLMGYGPTAVAPSTGTGAGTASDPAYRMWTSADPATLNHLNYADSVESDFLSLTAGQLMSFEWKLDDNGKGIGWEVKPEMLSVLPYPVDENGDAIADFSGLNEYTTWKFDLRHDLKWENGDKMDANDFIYTYKLVLDPELNMKRANYFYGGSTPIQGAKAYFDGNAEWDTVGIKQVDDYSFTITFALGLKLWDVEYGLSGFLHSPVHKATWEASLNADGTPRYGTSKDTYMASGAYKISYWEKGKEYRFTKNENYFVWNDAAENVEVRRSGYENYSYTIVKDSNAALELFKNGQLDVTSVPSSAYDEYKNWPSQKFSPGATSFRLSVNRFTQAELDAKFGTGSWEAKPILQEDDFTWALYFGMDRLGVQEITKTSTAWASYFTNAYFMVTPTEDGVDSTTYRESEWGQKVYEGLTDLDYDLLYDELGYAPSLATSFYISALDSMVEKGVFDPSKPYKVDIEIASFDGATHEAIFAYVVQNYNTLFNSAEVKAKYPNVTFEAVYSPQPGMDVYYVKQMTGQYDLAIAGINGGEMDPAGFMECFCDDNRSGLLLSLGFDSHNANILINLDLDGDGVLDGEKYWSFDALYSALMGDVFVKNGMEAEEPAE